jgi:hypothetical protein
MKMMGILWSRAARTLCSSIPLSPGIFQLGALGELALQCEKVYGPRRDIEWAFQDGMLYLVQCRAITTGKEHSEAPQPGPPRRDPAAALQRVELFTGMDRRQSEQIARLLKERRFTKGETVIMEGTGGTAFFLIDSGEARVFERRGGKCCPCRSGQSDAQSDGAGAPMVRNCAFRISRK